MSLYHTSRRLLSITGTDAASFLQGMITQDIASVRTDALQFTALLSAQGKLLHDGFLLKTESGFLFDIDADHADAVLTLLKRYRLRAKVDFAFTTLTCHLGTKGMLDPRHPALPLRNYSDASDAQDMPLSEYHQQRIHLAIPEAASDTISDTPMDLAYDLLHAISFTKGCYIGQEVTARMKYKQIARKLPMRIDADAPLPDSPAANPIEIMANTTSIGTVRSTLGTSALALIKLDGWETANQHTQTFTAQHIPMRLQVPEWAAARLEQRSQGTSSASTQI